MNRIFGLIALSFTTVTSLLANDTYLFLFHDVATGLHQIRLPDGKSLYGDTTAVMGIGDFDLKSLDCDTRSALYLLGALTYKLENPVKRTNWISVEYYTPSDILLEFQKIINQAVHLNPIALQAIWHFLRDGNIHGAMLPGLIPQPERADLFKELFDWRAGQRPDAIHALEAIRLERERLDAIAVEAAAKRRAEEDARIRAALTTRRHTHHESDDEHASSKDRLLLPGKLKAH